MHNASNKTCIHAKFCLLVFRLLFKYFTKIFQIFLNIISFQHVLHFNVGRSQIDWNLKVKSEISVCTAIMLNDHSNPYIESTTIHVLSDYTLCACTYISIYICMYIHNYVCYYTCTCMFIQIWLHNMLICKEHPTPHDSMEHLLILRRSLAIYV